MASWGSMKLPRLPTSPPPSPGRAARGLGLVRYTTGLVLAMHPLHALTHPAYRAQQAFALGEVGLPVSPSWVAVLTVVQLALALALLLGRGAVVGCIGNAVVLLATIALFQAPYWYILGGGADDEHPGAELSVLLVAYLAAILWSRRRRTAASPSAALHLAGSAAALCVALHPLHALVTWDVDGVRDFGAGMERLGFPCGVALVCAILSAQLVCSLALLARRFVVPACCGHLFILASGVAISHWPRWFVQGPGAGGTEYSVLLLSAFSAVLWASLPRGAAAAARPAATPPRPARVRA